MKTIQKVIPPILSIAIFLVIAILMSTVPSLNTKIDEYFVVQMIGSTIAILLTYAVWIPTGEDKANEIAKVKNNKLIYDNRANYIVEHQMFTDVGLFCVYKNDKLKAELIRDKLSTQVINYDVYELYVKKDKDVDEQHRLDVLMQAMTPKQRRLIERLATKGIHFQKLHPKNITMGKAVKSSIVNKNNEKAYKYTRMALKSVWGIFTTCFTYFVVITPNDSFGIPQIVMITMWFFTFLMAIYSAIQTGYRSIAVYRDTYNREQGELCAEFFAWHGDNTLEIDSEIASKLVKTEN